MTMTKVKIKQLFSVGFSSRHVSELEKKFTDSFLNVQHQLNNQTEQAVTLRRGGLLPTHKTRYMVTQMVNRVTRFQAVKSNFSKPLSISWPLTGWCCRFHRFSLCWMEKSVIGKIPLRATLSTNHMAWVKQRCSWSHCTDEDTASHSALLWARSRWYHMRQNHSLLLEEQQLTWYHLRQKCVLGSCGETAAQSVSLDMRHAGSLGTNIGPHFVLFTSVHSESPFS